LSFLEDAKNVLDIEIQGLSFAKNNLNESFNDVVKAIQACKGRLVVTGMGKSGLVGAKIAATCASTGTRSFFIHPGEAYHGDLGMISKEDIILAISNSGETEEVIKLLSFFKDNGNQTIAMCAKENSTLVKHSNFWLNISIEKEACPLELAPTSSTTVTMALGDALAIALMNAKNFKAENFARFHPGGSLGRKLLVKVKDVMRTDSLPVLKEDDSFEEVISVIGSGRLGMAVVLDKNDNVYGVITDGDLRRALQENKEKVLSFQAKEMASSSPKSIDKEEKIVMAEKLMNDKKISALLVKEGDKLAGILHLYDL
jgi:arabinose-5-phosphate isomerase